LKRPAVTPAFGFLNYFCCWLLECASSECWRAV
jgi:hypothetical protein